MPTLAYDDFPVSSTILRERKDGALYITVPASEPDARAMRNARMHSATSAAATMVYVLAVLAVPFAILVWQIRGRLPASAYLLMAVLVIALFALLWRDFYQQRRDALEAAWRHVAILVLGTDEILVQMEDRELTLPRRNVLAITVIGEKLLSKRLPRLVIRMDNGTVELLEGRDPAELQWVRRRLAEWEIPMLKLSESEGAKLE
jgi:hypothetical protein